MKKVTQTDISKALGISQATVGLVVGNTNSPLRARLHPETVQKILDKAREMGYVPHRGAQMMRKGKSNLIVLLNFGGYSEITAQRVFHIGRNVHAEGFDFQTIDAYWWASGADQMIAQVISLQPEGVIVTGSIQNDFGPRHIEELQARGIPVVSVGLRFPGVPRARYTALQSQYLLTRRLAESGRRRLLMLSQLPVGDPSWQSQERLEGFSQAVRECGGKILELNSQKGFPKASSRLKLQAGILKVPARKDQFSPCQRGMDAMRDILQWGNRPDALVCINDVFAIGAMSTAFRQNVVIPEEIAFTGFDNITFSSQGPIPLTTIEQPIEEICHAVMELLKSLIGKSPDEIKTSEERIFPCRVIWRDSSGVSSESTSAEPCRRKKDETARLENS